MTARSVSLREHLEALLDERTELLKARLACVEDLRVTDHRAVEAARSAMEYRLEKLNEFRAAMEDAQQQMLPRREAQALIDGLRAEIADVHRDVARVSDRLPRFITDDEYDRRHQALTDALALVSEQVTSLLASQAAVSETRRAGGDTYSRAVATVSLVLSTIVSVVLLATRLH